MVSMWREGSIRQHRGIFLALCASLLAVFGSVVKQSAAIDRDRNFFGAVQVVDVEEDGQTYRKMIHGGIVHGLQAKSPELHTEPLGYYARESGIGRAMAAAHGRGPIHLGLVGLGVGTSLEHLRRGDRARVYEIDQLVIDMARKHFDVVPRHEHQTSMVLGDARVSLEREGNQEFDVLGLDAFSGDAIPMHLLSLEAFDVYARHVKPSGYLCVHVSNRYLDLRPVVREAAHANRWHARVIYSEANDKGVLMAHWIVLSRDAKAFDGWDDAKDLPDAPAIVPWTDDFSSLWSVLRASR